MYEVIKSRRHGYALESQLAWIVLSGPCNQKSQQTSDSYRGCTGQQLCNRKNPYSTWQEQCLKNFTTCRKLVSSILIIKEGCKTGRKILYFMLRREWSILYSRRGLHLSWRAGSKVTSSSQMQVVGAGWKRKLLDEAFWSVSKLHYRTEISCPGSVHLFQYSSSLVIVEIFRRTVSVADVYVEHWGEGRSWSVPPATPCRVDYMRAEDDIQEDSCQETYSLVMFCKSQNRSF